MKLLAIFLCISVYVMPSKIFADTWVLNERWSDPFSGEVVTAARTENKDGFGIAIFRSADDRVRAVFSLPNSSFDRLPLEGRVLLIRPDNFESREIEVKPRHLDVYRDATSNGMAVRNLLWHGEGSSPTRGTFRDMLDSTTLFGRFLTDEGLKIDTSWDLSGSRPILEAALSITASVDAEAQEWDNLVAETLINSSNRCTDGHVDVACLDAVSFCANYLITDKDLSGYKSCLAKAGH